MYQKLKKIDRPVLIFVTGDFKVRNRTRVLFPDGSCLFSYSVFGGSDIERSCFNYRDDFQGSFPSFDSLEQSIEQMEYYDKSVGLKITKIIKL